MRVFECTRRHSPAIQGNGLCAQHASTIKPRAVLSFVAVFYRRIMFTCNVRGEFCAFLC